MRLMSAPTTHFDWQDPAHAQSWIDERTNRNPLRGEHLSLVLELLAVLQPDGQRILDLGCGDGVVAALLLDRFPAAHLTGVDTSPPMLERARERLAAYPGRWTLYQSTMQEVDTLDLPTASFDAAIGIQSIHHLTGAEKQTLFQRVAGLLRPGGLFLLSDRVRLADAGLFPYHRAIWNRLQAQHGLPTASAEYTYASHQYAAASRGDQPDTVEDQLVWLQAAGFGAVDCFYRHVQRAIFGGLNGPARPDPAPPDPDLVARMDQIHTL
jgi:tRNA (cmo5U34)-methyltransferase